MMLPPNGVTNAPNIQAITKITAIMYNKLLIVMCVLLRSKCYINQVSKKVLQPIGLNDKVNYCLAGHALLMTPSNKAMIAITNKI